MKRTIAAAMALAVAAPANAATEQENFVAGLTDASRAALNLAANKPAVTFVCAHYATENVKKPEANAIDVRATFKGAVVIMGGKNPQLIYQRVDSIDIADDGASAAWQVTGQAVSSQPLGKMPSELQKQIAMNIVASELTASMGINLPVGCQSNLIIR